MEFTSNKPYLLRAIHDWVLDNEATPHILISALDSRVEVPQQFVEDGKIILNVSPSAANNLLIDNDGVSFSARFGGKPFTIYSPMGSVLALYASETGEGMSFEEEEFDGTPPDGPDGKPPSPKSVPDSNVQPIKKASNKTKKRPTLKVVK
ncbi:MAG: ClpXP protease specificity-enhancing factor [Cocleimonas sp.]